MVGLLLVLVVQEEGMVLMMEWREVASLGMRSDRLVTVCPRYVPIRTNMTH